MELSLDLGKFITAVKNAEADTGKCDLIETEGEQYVFENIFKRFLKNEKVKVSDIDFDAFEEDDITLIVDDKFRKLENVAQGGRVIAEFFVKAAPAVTRTRGFF